MQSYVQPLLDAVYTTTFSLQGGVPHVDTLQSTFSSAVEEAPPAQGRLPSTPTQPVPSAPSHISSALKRRLRQIALSLAAHFRSSRRQSDTFTFHCLRDARSRFCIAAMHQMGHTRGAGKTLAATTCSTKARPAAPFSQALSQSSLVSHRHACGSRDETRSELDMSRTHSYTYSVAPSSVDGTEQSRRGLDTEPSVVRSRPRSANPKLAQHDGDSQSFRCSSLTRPRSALAGACRTSGSSYRADPGRYSGGKQDAALSHRQPGKVSRDNLAEAVDRRGVPRVLDSMVSELETMRETMLFQHQVIESHSKRANKAEGELEAVQSTCNARLQSMQVKLEAATAELATLRAEHRVSAQQASSANDRARSLESQVKELTGMVDSERGTTIKALGEYQSREGQLARRVQILEGELLSTKESLKQEQAAVAAMKNQTVALSDELQQVHKEYPPRTIADAGILDILASISQLLQKESNPAGERYAVQKVVVSHSQELRSTFLCYCQLDSTFAQHWPPSMMQHQFLAFCRDSETADPRAGARGRGSSAGMLPISEAQEAFDIFANNEDGAREYSSLPYEGENFPSHPAVVLQVPRWASLAMLAGFVSSLIWISSRLKSHAASFLSEAFRSYILRCAHLFR